MSWKNVAKIIKKAAPVLGTVIGGPIGGTAGGIISLVASAFGVNNNPDEIIEAIKKDPNAAIKLKEIETKHKEKLEKLAIESDEIFLKDRQNARTRQVESEKATGTRDYNLYFIAWTVICGFFGLCVVLMYVNIPSGQNEVIFMLFGALSSSFGAVIQYFFGSSKSSTDKTHLLRR